MPTRLDDHDLDGAEIVAGVSPGRFQALRQARPAKGKFEKSGASVLVRGVERRLDAAARMAAIIAGPVRRATMFRHNPLVSPFRAGNKYDGWIVPAPSKFGPTAAQGAKAQAFRSALGLRPKCS